MLSFSWWLNTWQEMTEGQNTVLVWTDTRVWNTEVISVGKTSGHVFADEVTRIRCVGKDEQHNIEVVVQGETEGPASLSPAVDV